jgi:hypothetical protein
MLADLSPALLWPRPNTCPEVSLRCRLSDRADVGVFPPAVGGLEGWPAAEGARLTGMEGDGDERERVTPLVWMPGGIGRLILVETVAAGEVTAEGAIVDAPAAADGSD